MLFRIIDKAFHTIDEHNKVRKPRPRTVRWVKGFYELSVDYEIVIITKAMTESKGSITKASELLNIGRTTLSGKLRKYGIKKSTFLYHADCHT